MSCVAEFRQLEKQLAEQLAALEAIKSDEVLKKEVEFETKRGKWPLKSGWPKFI